MGDGGDELDHRNQCRIRGKGISDGVFETPHRRGEIQLERMVVGKRVEKVSRHDKDVAGQDSRRGYA